MSRRFRTHWLPLREADRFVATHHRHHVPAQGGIVSLGLWEGERLVGVAVLGRPLSRELQRQRVAEITQALGFERLVTYTLPDEGGASLRAAAFQQDLILTNGGEWDTPSLRRNKPLHPIARKTRWWAHLKQQPELDLT